MTKVYVLINTSCDDCGRSSYIRVYDYPPTSYEIKKMKSYNGICSKFIMTEILVNDTEVEVTPND